MAENDNTDTTKFILEEETLFLEEVIAGDAELYFLDCFLSEILRKR